jgi:methylase of polypeptide subunit release factors
MKISSRLALGLYRSRLVARLLFGGPLPALGAGDRYFDVTTLALRQRVRERVAAGSRVLEIGTGSFAILARWMCRELDARVCCTEIDATTAGRARACVELEGLDIEVHEGSLFASLEESTDLVIFNPPYLPRALGLARGLSDLHRRQWDGGPDGTAVLREFLAALRGRGEGACALVGLNEQHVSTRRVRDLVEELGGLELMESRHQSWLPGVVHELRVAASANSS